MNTTHLISLLREACDPCTADPYDGRYITITPDELVRFVRLLSRQPSQLDPRPPHRDCGCADCAPSFDEKLDSTRTALVNPKAYWVPITDKTPRGAKCFLINRPAKSATTGVVGTEEKFFTHYFPMPVFDPDEEQPCPTKQPTSKSS